MTTVLSHIEATSFRIPAGHAWVDGELSAPEDPKGLVVFANGSGSSRHSPRDQAVAAYMNEQGFASLLLDLLAPHEGLIDESTGEFSLDVPMLAGRLVDATEWLSWNQDTATLKVGYLASGTGVGAALMAAADLPSLVQGVVSRGGRPDWAGPALAEVKAPTLFIAGGLDEAVLEASRSALEVMTCEKDMEIIHGTGSAFTEPGALEEHARLARAWFDRHLAG
jgi:putative phosphoribosyl transferase